MKCVNKYTKLFEEFITEAPISYDDQNRMESGIEKSFNKGEHPLAKNPAYPNPENNDTFDQLIASKRFKDVIDRLKKYLNIKTEVINIRDVHPILVNVYNTILKIEANNSKKLEKLAVDLVKKEFNLSDDDLILNANLSEGGGNIDISDIPVDPKKLKNLEELNLEVEKRKFINGLIQGAAVKTQYAYYLIQDDLEKIHPGLTDMYTILNILTEYGYWITPDEIIKQAGQKAGVGKVKIDLSGDTPKVESMATSFPFLVHELVKGVVEVLTQHTQLSPEENKYVIDKTDSLSQENMALRIGPAYWEKLNTAIYDSGYEKYRNNIIAYLSHLKAQDFNSIMKDILATDNKNGIEKLKKIGKEIEVDLRNQ